MKKMIALTAILFCLFSFSVFAEGSQDKGSEKLVIKIGHGAPTTDARHIASETFKKIVEEETNGKVEVQIYPASQLGNWSEMLEGMQLKTMDILIEDIGTLETYSPYCSIGFTPFLYDSKAHFEKVWTSSAGDKIKSILEEETGYKFFGFMKRGPRNINSNKPVHELADMKGLKIRVPGSKTMSDCFKALGASPQAMAFPEVFGAIQQKVIDAQENPVDVIYTNSIYEVAPYVLFSEHVYGAFNFIFWGDTFNSYPADVQAAMMKGIDAASAEYNATIDAGEQKMVDDMKSKPGVTLSQMDPAEKAKWAGIIRSEVLSKRTDLKKVYDLIDSAK